MYRIISLLILSTLTTSCADFAYSLAVEIAGNTARTVNDEPFQKQIYTYDEDSLLTHCGTGREEWSMQKPFENNCMVLLWFCLDKYETRLDYCKKQATLVCNPTSKYKLKDEEICKYYKEKYGVYK